MHVFDALILGEWNVDPPTNHEHTPANQAAVSNHFWDVEQETFRVTTPNQGAQHLG